MFLLGVVASFLISDKHWKSKIPSFEVLQELEIVAVNLINEVDFDVGKIKDGYIVLYNERSKKSLVDLVEIKKIPINTILQKETISIDIINIRKNSNKNVFFTTDRAIDDEGGLLFSTTSVEFSDAANVYNIIGAPHWYRFDTMGVYVTGNN